jgi:acyl carrier protein
MKEDDIDVHRPLGQYGIDSLVALETMNWIGKEMGTELAIFEISGEATVKGIGELVSLKSAMRPKQWKN